MAKIKVTRTVEYVGEPEAMAIQLDRSLKLGTHFQGGHVQITVTQITCEPYEEPKKPDFYSSITKDFCK